MLKRKYGNGSMETEVRKSRACCSPLTDKPFLEEGPMQRSNRNSSKTLEAVFFLVLVKCRQNVANKLFISRYFNPCNKLTALMAKCLLNALMNPKEVEASSFSLWKCRIYIHNCCGGCWSIWKCWLCGTSSKYGPSFIANYSTIYHCKKGKVVLTQFGYLSFLPH